MIKKIQLSLVFAFGLSPILYAAPTANTVPDYVISLYDFAKSGYEKLTKQGYKPERMFITVHGITATDISGLVPNNINMIIDSFDEAKSHGDDTAALFYKTAQYAIERGDNEIAAWMNFLLAHEMAETNVPGWLGTLASFTSMAAMATIAGLIIAFSYRPVSNYAEVKRRAMFAPASQDLVLWR